MEKKIRVLSPPLEQIVTRLKNKIEWQELDWVYYNIYNLDFKIVREWDEEDRIKDNRPFYSYNQCNESTSFSRLKIVYRETVLKEFEVVILDSGRYSTPTPTWGFIHDKIYKSKSLYAYKYILKDSIDYVVQQFLYDEDREEARFAKGRFDEVVLYFENKEEQQEFHKAIEDNPEIIEQYIEDYKLDKYIINSNNKLEVKDATNKLIVGFAFNRFLFDYRRRKQGIVVKRIKSVKATNYSLGLIGPDDIAKHQIDISEKGTVRHSIYNRESNKSVQTNTYKVDKYWMRRFLNFLEPITTGWDKDYSVMMCDGYEWEFIIKYSDGTSKKVKGTVVPPPDGEEVERRIKVLAKFDIEPFIF